MKQQINEISRMQQLAGLNENQEIENIKPVTDFSKNKTIIKDTLTDDFFKALDYFSEYYKKDSLGKQFKTWKTLMLNLKNNLNNYQRKH